MFAAKQGHLDVVKTLMEKDNLDVNAQENVSDIAFYLTIVLFISYFSRKLNLVHHFLLFNAKNWIFFKS